MERLAIAILLAASQLPAELGKTELASSPAASAVRALSPAQLPATRLELSQLPQLNRASSVKVQGVDLRLLLSALAQANGLNLVMAQDITDTVNADLDNVTLTQALEAILTPRGLKYEIEGGLLRVVKPQMETRTFHLNYITTSRTLSRSLSATATAGIGQAGGALGGAGVAGGSSTSVSGTETTNLLTELETALNTLKSTTGKIVVQKMAGVVLATDLPANLDAMQSFLETVQNVVNRQVVIEAKIIEVKLNNDSQVGVNWTAVLGNSANISQTLAGQGTFQIAATTKNFSALITLLSNQGKVNVLSSPTVATLNNQPAVIRSGTQDIFFTNQTLIDARTGAIITNTQTPSTINEGIVLDVTPQISDDGIIMMNVHPTISERTGQAVSPRGDTVPIIDVRETDTVVRVAEGDTIVIAGLISDRTLEQRNRVPVLGDLPVVGGLFRKTEKETRKSDLVILLTPRILSVKGALDFTKQRMDLQEQLRRERD